MTGPRPHDREQSVGGSLLLSACGDALGARYEGAGTVDPAGLGRWLAAPDGVLRWTDDTAMTLVLAEHLGRRRGTVAADQLAGAFAAEWSREPHRGYGAGAAAVLARIADGSPWQQVAPQLFGGAGSFGNGAAMRVAPVGLVAGRSLAEVAAAARASAEVTHSHRLGCDGAAVQAVAVAAAAASGAAGDPVAPGGFVADVAAHADTSEFRAVLPRVAELAQRSADPDRAAAALGNDVSALGSVPVALLAFLRSPDDPADVVRFAIRVGGDTDTIAAMAGALAGARCGESAVPAGWRDRVEQLPRIRSAAAGVTSAGR